MWKSRAGTVTVSLVLLVAPLFAFHATLIDAARVKMADREAETATKAALRSVMSAFDPALQTYGLYGLGNSAERSEALFADVLETNLTVPDGTALQLVEPVAASQTLQPLYTLANRTVFERQVMEEMKYRAPVEFAVSVTEKLKNRSKTASMLNSYSQFAKDAKKIGQLIDDREQELDAAWNAAQDIGEKAPVLRGYYAGKLERMDALARKIGIHTADELRSSIQQLRTQVDELNRTITEQRRSLADLYRAGQQAAQQIAAIQQTIGLMEQNVAALQAKINEFEQILQAIAELTVLLAATKAEAKHDRDVLQQMTQSVYERLDRAKAIDEQIRSELNASTTPGSDIPPEALAAATVPDAYFLKFKTGLGGIAALFNGFENALDATTLFVGATKFDAARYALLGDSNAAYAQKAESFIAEQRAEEQKRSAANGRVAERRRQEGARFAKVWDEARKIWAECGNGTEEAYKRLEVGDPDAGMPSLFRQYMDYNRTEPGDDAAVGEWSGAEAAAERTTGLVDGLLAGLGEAAVTFRDELYFNEFALTKFNYRTYGKEKGPDGNPKKDYELSARGSHVLQGQEAEYLLYGLDSCLQNQSAAYTEMFAIRLAVRTTEALMSPDQKVIAFGNPMLTLLWALAEGAVKAYDDMTKLVNGEEVPVTAKAPDNVTMNYKDYLRLFFLLHTKREPMTARMQSLIELNTGRDLRQTAVYVQARTETKVRLWFMPYALAALGYPVEGNSAVIVKTASLSY